MERLVQINCWSLAPGSAQDSILIRVIRVFRGSYF